MNNRAAGVGCLLEDKLGVVAYVALWNALVVRCGLGFYVGKYDAKVIFVEYFDLREAI